jgi:hydrogenase expression/formation protein HypC
MQVVRIEGGMAIAEVDGVRREASLMMLSEEIKEGDYILIHAGFAISRLDEDEALETLELMRDCLELGQETA